MAMGWLKGLVAPAAQFAGAALQGQPGAPGTATPGGPPVGGAPYGVVPGGPPVGGMAGPGFGGGAHGTPGAPGAAPGFASTPGFDAAAMQWSTGTKTQGGGAPSAGGGGAIPGAATAPGSLEARCAELQQNVESLALFARTLLTMLEEAKVVTRAQFEETKHRLDMIDGKLDDR